MASGISKGMSFLTHAAGPLFGMQLYVDERSKGRSVLGSAAIAGVEAWAFTMFQWPILAFQLAPLIDSGLQMMNRQTGNMQRNITPNSAFGIRDDFAAAQTSRARGMNAIMDSRLNARSFLGSEAGLFSARYR